MLNAVGKYNKNGFCIGELLDLFDLSPQLMLLLSFTVVFIIKAYIFFALSNSVNECGPQDVVSRLKLFLVQLTIKRL